MRIIIFFHAASAGRAISRRRGGSWKLQRYGERQQRAADKQQGHIKVVPTPVCRRAVAAHSVQKENEGRNTGWRHGVFKKLFYLI